QAAVGYDGKLGLVPVLLAHSAQTHDAQRLAEQQVRDHKQDLHAVPQNPPLHPKKSGGSHPIDTMLVCIRKSRNWRQYPSLRERNSRNTNAVLATMWPLGYLGTVSRPIAGTAGSPLAAQP